MNRISPIDFIKYKHNNGFEGHISQMDTSSNTQDENFITESFENLESIKDAYAKINTIIAPKPEYKNIGLNLFKYKDYYIKTGKKVNLDAEATNLKAIKPFKLSCAPELVSAIALGNNQDMVIITRVEGTKEKEPEKYSITKTNASLQAKKRLLEDFDKLSTIGVYNPAIIESTKNWMYIPETDNIYVDDWSRLKLIGDKKELVSLRKELRDMTGIIFN